MRSWLLIVAILAMGSLVASPALAAHRKAKPPTVSCKEIKDAIAAGKAADDVAKDLKTTAARVKTCTTPAKHRSHPPKG